MSDIAFLQKLCHDAGCSLKVSNNIIVIFDQATYEKKSEIMTIRRGERRSDGYSQYKLWTGKNGTYTSCQVIYTTASGKVISATAYSADYEKKKKDGQCLKIYQKVTSVAEAKRLAEKMLRLYNKYELQASFTFPGNPKLLAGCTVMLSGWGAWDGKYVIRQASHKVDHSGYVTQIALRTALASGVSASSSESSKSAKVSETKSKADAVFSEGDRVICNDGVTENSSGVPMEAWMLSTLLYVRAVERSGRILLVSTERGRDVHTERVWAKDVHKV